MLEIVEGGTCQDMEKNQPTKGHSHPGDGSGRDLSEYGKQVTKQGGTHSLEMVEGGTCQDMGGN